MAAPYIISGIQQVGVGVADAKAAWADYRQLFGVDVPVFQEEAVANLMLPYTGGEPRSRFAILALNMQGGGGFEIWQYTKRVPQAPENPIRVGDLGILSAKIKCRDTEEVKAHFQVPNAPKGQFFVMDKYGNPYHIVQSDNWFSERGQPTGGIFGAIIGVSDIQKSLFLYQNILGYDHIVSDKTGVFEDLKALNGGERQFRRVVLAHSEARKGAFSRLLGATEIELLQCVDTDFQPKKMYDNRFWGDLGFIHLCFDVNGMDNLKATCEKNGYRFTVDSANSFDMGDAAGRFAYIEDPDGTLIEFVETHKVPIAKKWGIFLNLKKRNPEKALPNLVVKALGLNRVK